MAASKRTEQADFQAPGAQTPSGGPYLAGGWRAPISLIDRTGQETLDLRGGIRSAARRVDQHAQVAGIHGLESERIEVRLVALAAYYLA
jgi:hypothetical protein